MWRNLVTSFPEVLTFFSSLRDNGAPAGRAATTEHSPQIHVPNSRKVHSPSDYRPDIDGLRTLAIIPVMMFHAFPAMMPGGFVGVDVFFVISGYLISRILMQALQGGNFNFAGFYANRIRRLFPALLVVLAGCFAFGWFFLLPDEYERLGKHMVGAAAYVENFVLRREAGYFDVRSSVKPLMHLWSLGIEEQFYLSYPLFLWLMWRWRRNLFPVLVAIAVVSFSVTVVLVRRDPTGAFFLPQTRCWELTVGCAIACWQLLSQEKRPNVASHWVVHLIGSGSLQNYGVLLRNAISGTGILLIAIAVLRIHENDLFPGWSALLPVGGAGLLIVAGPEAWINREVLATKVAVFVGLISYPLYLWHWPILTFIRILHGSEVSASVRIAGLILSFGLAWGTFHFVESPIRFGRKNWIGPVALLTTSVLIATFGYAADRDGFISRFPKYADDLGHLRDVVWSTPECRSLSGIAGIDYCRTTSPNPPDVLLIGDSHASVLYDGLAPAYQKRSLTLMNLGQAGCVPFYDTDSFTTVRHKDCTVPVNRMLDFAIRAPSVRTIILSSRGPRYMSGQGFGPAEADSAAKKIMRKGAAKGAPQSEMYTGALRQTISLLNRSGKNLVVFLDWPELGFDPRTCLPRPVRFLSHPRLFCAVSRTKVDARNHDYRAVIFQLKQDFPGLMIFDPLPYLCDSSACYGLANGHLLYSDDNHVSIAGAEFLSEKFFQTSPVDLLGWKRNGKKF